MLREFKPTHFQLATEYNKCNSLLKDTVLQRDRYYYEEKIDGSRVAVIIEDGKVVSLINRRGTDILCKYPHLKADRFDNALYGIDAILDGEIYVNNALGISKLNLLHSTGNKHKARVMIFDVLKIGDTDMRVMPFYKRREHLCTEIPFGGNFDLISHFKNFNLAWEYVKLENREGVVAKKKKARYIAGRSGNFIKIKNWKERIIEFRKLEVTKTGVTLISKDEMIRVACNGKQSAEVIDIMRSQGGVKAEIQYLFENDSGKLYQPTFKRLVKK